jgi:hypothetical protein
VDLSELHGLSPVCGRPAWAKCLRSGGLRFRAPWGAVSRVVGHSQ